MAERYGDELAAALPEADAVAGFGVPVTLGRKAAAPALPSFDLLTCPGRRRRAPWAYVKVAEGCDKACGFCAIPTFRGPQRSRDRRPAARRGRRPGGRRRARDRARRPGPGQLRARPGGGRAPARPARAGGGRAGRPGAAAVPLPVAPRRRADRRDPAPPACPTSTCRCSTCPRRSCAACAAGATATASSRASTPSAPARPRPPSGRTSSSATPARPRTTTTSSSRSSRAAQLDWCGFFAYSREDGTYAADLDGAVPAPARGRAPGRAARAAGRHHRGCAATSSWARWSTCSSTRPASARSHREAPEIDGIITVPEDLAVGALHRGARSPAPPVPTARPSPSRWCAAVVSASRAGDRAVRAVGAGHAGQPRSPSAGCSLTIPLLVDGRRRRRVVGGASTLWIVPVPHRLGRRHPRPPPGHHPLGRLPRPAGRQGARARRARARWWPRARSGGCRCALIAVRELGIQAFRSFWARRGLAVPATELAKVKTVVQQVAVGLRAPAARPRSDASWLADGLLWVAVVLTVVTGVQYVAGRQPHGHDRRQPVGAELRALRGRRRRHRAAARPDRRHQLGVDRRAARRRTASSTSARRRSATTTTASSTRSARRSTGPTR